MPIVPAKCTQCNANIEIDNTKDAAICKFCGCAFVVEKAINHYNTYIQQNFAGAVVNMSAVQSADEIYKNCYDYMKRLRRLPEDTYKEFQKYYPNDFRIYYLKILELSRNFSRWPEEDFKEIQNKSRSEFFYEGDRILQSGKQDDYLSALSEANKQMQKCAEGTNITEFRKAYVDYANEYAARLSKIEQEIEDMRVEFDSRFCSELINSKNYKAKGFPEHFKEKLFEICQDTKYASMGAVYVAGGAFPRFFLKNHVKKGLFSTEAYTQVEILINTRAAIYSVENILPSGEIVIKHQSGPNDVKKLFLYWADEDLKEMVLIAGYIAHGSVDRNSLYSVCGRLVPVLKR